MVTYTSNPLYWASLKPRIRIYALNDSTYASPLYTYNPFTDVGSTTKPISLNFDSEIINVGSFSIEIEDKDSTLDPDVYSRGNRIFIDCSKDGITFQPAFKGLVRGTQQNIYSRGGRNLIINGYSYLVRLTERIINTIRESTITGADYDRTDSSMFSNNLINDLLTTDSNYVNSVDDTQLYSILKTGNITSSPVVDWIPRLDAQLVTVSDALNSVLEFSNSLIMLNPADDQLVLYNTDLVTSATGIFLITNQSDSNADDANYTMYPLEPYTYELSYDNPQLSSRIIGSIGNYGCPAETEDNPTNIMKPWVDISCTITFWADGGIQHADALAVKFTARGGVFSRARVAFTNDGNCSDMTSHVAQIRLDSGANEPSATQVGDDIILYRDSIPNNPYPSTSTVAPNIMVLGMEEGIEGPTLTNGSEYWFCIFDEQSSSSTHRVEWIMSTCGSGTIYYYSVLQEGQVNWATFGDADGSAPGLRFDYASKGGGPCGGGQGMLNSSPVMTIAQDMNMSNRLGVVERVVAAPQHVKTKQTLEEYLFQKLYYTAKPRFKFNYPSVSMPNKLPKAGDIITHVDSVANIGLSTSPLQTGIISSIQYEFSQGTDTSLGLRRIGLSTTGIKRGSY